MAHRAKFTLMESPVDLPSSVGQTSRPAPFANRVEQLVGRVRSHAANFRRRGSKVQRAARDASYLRSAVSPPTRAMLPMSVRASIVATVMAFASTTATVAATASIARAQTPAPRFKVLVIAERLDPRGGGDEIHRPYVEAADAWLARLAADSSFTVSWLDSPNTITDSVLATVNVIWQMNYTPFRWNAAARAALEKYLESGKGGWLGVHHASLYGPAVTRETWPWFRDNLLGGINYRNYVSRFAAGTVRVEDGAHPVLKHVPASFRISTEEWYVWDRSPRAQVHVLASVDESSYEFVDASQRGIRMGDHPVIWTNDKLRGRNLYVFMGHHPNLFANSAYTTLLTSSIMWLANEPARARP
jgi:type 1 glutamine amidotransferase